MESVKETGKNILSFALKTVLVVTGIIVAAEHLLPAVGEVVNQTASSIGSIIG